MAELDVQYLADVVNRVRSGDEDAFAELYAATYQKQYLFAYCYLGEDSIAKEALEETYLHAYKRLNELSDSRLFVSWINQINFRVCYSTAAKQTLKESADNKGKTENNTAGMKQLLALPFSESQALFLYCCRNMSVKSIAYLMDIGEGTVKQYLKSGQKRLGNQVELFRNSQNTQKLDKELKSLRRRKNCETLLSAKEAQDILQSVYRGVDKPACNIPLDVLSTYVVYRKDRYRFQKGSLTVIMLLFLILPVFFYVPRLDLQELKEEQNRKVQILQVKSLIPILNVEAYVDGVLVPVAEIDKGVYAIQPDRNGELIVSVLVWNGQSVSVASTIAVFDTESPYLVDSYVKDGMLHLQFKDDQSGVDFSSARIFDENGVESVPVTISDEIGEITLEKPKSSVTIYVEDEKGNNLQLTIEIAE